MTANRVPNSHQYSILNYLLKTFGNTYKIAIKTETVFLRSNRVSWKLWVDIWNMIPAYKPFDVKMFNSWWPLWQISVIRFCRMPQNSSNWIIKTNCMQHFMCGTWTPKEMFLFLLVAVKESAAQKTEDDKRNARGRRR